MKYCPNCGCPVTAPEHEADECYSCGEPIGLWYRVDDDEIVELPELDWKFWVLVGACVTGIAVWFGLDNQ